MKTQISHIIDVGVNSHTIHNKEFFECHNLPSLQ
jgi:hypothetical protein